MVEGIVSGERISLKRSVSERYRITLVTAVQDTFFLHVFQFGDGFRLVGPRRACLNFTRILDYTRLIDYETYMGYKNLFSI